MVLARYRYVKFAYDFAVAGFLVVAGSWFRGSHARVGRVFQDVIPSPHVPSCAGSTLAASKYGVAPLEAAKQLPRAR